MPELKSPKIEFERNNLPARNKKTRLETIRKFPLLDTYQIKFDKLPLLDTYTEMRGVYYKDISRVTILNDYGFYNTTLERLRKK